MKILIIGAGPIGCYIAKLLEGGNKSLDINLIEEHLEIGRPIHCAGLISEEAIAQLRVNLGKDFILNHIDGAELYHNNDSFAINRKNVALVIDREKFDQALGQGLNIDFNTRFVGIEKDGSGYLVETDKGEYYADIVVGADGANSVMRKAGKFKGEIDYLRGVQFRMRYSKCNRHIVQVHLKTPFFAWIIPESDAIARVGILSYNPYHDLIGFLKENSIEGEILDKFAGLVPVGRCSTRNGNLALVGDAACQVKPLTYGGIYYGMRCAEILADCIINNQLPQYEKQWQARFGREIEIGLKIRRLYKQLNQEDMIKIFNILKDNAGLLERFGDFEIHSKFISAILKSRGLQNILGKILINFIRDTKI